MLDDCIQNLMAGMRIPGMSIAVVQAGEPVPIKSYGFANIEHNTVQLSSITLAPPLKRGGQELTLASPFLRGI